jgi:hypothetical protein
MNAPIVIGPRNPSKWAATCLRLRPRSHRDRLYYSYYYRSFVSERRVNLWTRGYCSSTDDLSVICAKHISVPERDIGVAVMHVAADVVQINKIVSYGVRRKWITGKIHCCSEHTETWVLRISAVLMFQRYFRTRGKVYIVEQVTVSV